MTWSIFQHFLMSSVLVMLMSCDKVSFDRVTGSMTFKGVDGFEKTSEGYVVSWQPAAYDSDVSYSIYLLEASQGVSLISSFNGTPQDLEAKGSRVAKLYELGEGMGPVFEPASRLVTSQLDKNYFAIPTGYISSQKNYLIQVQAETSDSGKKSTGNGKAVYLYTENLIKEKFYGCLTATASGADSISLTFQWPEAASKITIFRDGKQVYLPTQRLSAEMSFNDNGLFEGEQYNYTCIATVNGEDITGERTLTQKTLSSNPPNFQGLKTLTGYGTNGVSLTWNVPSSGSVRAASYQIYQGIGPTLSWSSAPIKTVSGSSLSTTVSGLGDELTYTFGVRACTSEPVCDTNVITFSYTVPNSGAPATIGATDVGMVNGAVTITAPWDHSKGAIAKRYVYQKLGAPTANFSDYSLARTVTVSDRYNPTTAISVSNLSENTVYSFIVRDEDPSSNQNSSLAAVSLNTGDLTPPTFGGISSLTRGAGASAENTLVASYTGVVQESVNAATGASAYLVYLASGSTNACLNSSPYQTITNTANAGDALTYSITGLNPRSTYSVCVKARDSRGNISNTNTYLTASTLDTTAPYFDGVQSLSYNGDAGRMEVVWNASTSSDVDTYVVRIWKNSVSSSGATVLQKSAASFASGFNFTTSDFSYTAGDLLYVKADACDNANGLSGGTQNCTNKADSTAKTLTVPDVVPPQGFTGVAGSGTFSAPAEGQVTVSWIAPASWTDYSGFKIYTVNTTDDSITVAKDCPCSAANCPNQITSCTVSGLNAYKTYYFHVRAYDGAGNLTTYLSPASSRTQYRTSDTAAPSFGSNLQLTLGGGGITLNYNAASDNQSSEGSLSYKVYRKATSTFASATNPSADGTLLATKTTLSHLDTTGAMGTAYYYAVCAVDSSNNSSCDGNIKSGIFPDSTAPVIASFTSNKTTDGQKEWTLSWSMSDNLTSSGSLRVKIYRSYTSGAAGTATTSDPELTNASGDAATIGSTSLTTVRGLAGTNTYINYLLRVEDDAGNVATSTLSVYSQNLMTVSSVWPTSGVTAGGKYIVIDGTGIDDAATVSVGNATCTAKIVIRSGYKLACKTPAGAGLNDITITNPSSSGSATLSNAYTYDNSVYCNASGRSSATPFANSSDGSGADGTITKPYKICTWTQLDAIRTSASSGSGKYWELADHIDAAGQAHTPITYNGSNIGYFDGKNYMVANVSYTTSTAISNVGLFGIVGGGYMKNIGVVNANFSYTGSNPAYSWGILAGALNNAGIVDNVYTSGTMDFSTGCVQDCGVGGVFGSANHSSSYITNAKNYANVAGPSATGGIVGRADQLNYVSNSLNTGTISCKPSTFTGMRCGGIMGFSGSNMKNLTNLTNVGNIVIQPSDATTYPYSAGGILGYFYPTAGPINYSNLVSTGNITGPKGVYVGGLVGYGQGLQTGTVSDSYFSGTIEIADLANAGGLFGLGDSGWTIQNSYSSGKIITTATNATNNIGGLVGRVNANTTYSPHTFLIDRSYSTMDITAGGQLIGGLVGSMYLSTANTKTFTIQDSYYIGNVICSANARCGGLVGSMSGISGTETFNILRSYSKGTLNATLDRAGGLIGYFQGGDSSGAETATLNVTDSYSTMNITSSSTLAGGLIGSVRIQSGGTSNYSITRSYYAGAITTGSAYNGIVTNTNGSTVTCTDTYFNTTTSGASSSGCTTGGTGKTTAQMQSSATFSNFDFTPTTGVWKMPATSGFPMLMWQ